jgi:hypothetical protein
MHTYILLAVEANSADDVTDAVELFNRDFASWSDWSDALDGSDNELGLAGVLCYEDNPKKFLDTVQEYQDATMKGVMSDLKYVGKCTVWELAMLKENRIFGGLDHPTMVEAPDKKDSSETSLNVYRALNVLNVIDGQFIDGQHFFDVEAHTPNTDCLMKRIQKNPSQQWLIIWDYHL